MNYTKLKYATYQTLLIHHTPCDTYTNKTPTMKGTEHNSELCHESTQNNPRCATAFEPGVSVNRVV